MRGELYQITLIGLGVIATGLFGVFVYREIFPEYKIYQKDYIALENFRSTYTGEPPPVFAEGVKQIVIERKDNGPPTIDRCISCHVALQIPAFSPTKIAKDINGENLLDSKGNPVQVTNEEYIWAKLDQKIADLTNTTVNEKLNSEGKNSEVKARLQEAEQLAALKTAHVGEHIYDVTKVLRMHPLIGKETRPFEFHPVEEYGCVSCHNGNGRALTTDKAHGPVFDGEYEEADEGPRRKFTETDPDNDPQFAYIFNSKPGETLIFQTTPIFVGPLMEAKCAQCHLTSSAALEWSLNSADRVTGHRTRNSNAVKLAYENEKRALASLLLIRNFLAKHGLEDTLAAWEKLSQDYSLPPKDHEAIESQLNFLRKSAGSIAKHSPADDKRVLDLLDQKIDQMTGSSQLSAKLEEATTDAQSSQQIQPILENFLSEYANNPIANGTIFKIATEWNLDQEIMKHVLDTEISLKKTVTDQQFMTSVKSDIDSLMLNYHHGQELYISQACYACHRIDAFSRGGVGPDLTKIGNYYPWYIKHHIVCPQCDLPTSTMPNFRLDHDELEDLVTFLLGQTGEYKAKSGSGYKVAVQEWEAGRKLPWEEPISPAQMLDVRFAMTVFATQGCAACHRLKGFESNVGFTIQKEGNKPDYESLRNEHVWFSKLFPEEIAGSDIVKVIDKNASEIDKHIADNIRKGSILEEIDQSHPELIEALYTNFKFANRAKNHYYSQLAEAEKDPAKKAEINRMHQEWQARVKRILMMYIQEYGLGRLIGPRPNWAGIYRSDEWLMEHFKNPGSHVPNSIMPIFPFDESKFFALTHMLNVLGISNRNEVRDIWEHQGFSPALAAHIHCSQCHGEFLLGNGPVAEWIYPIPKNLRNPDFLRNMTKEQLIKSITHGVNGTPMPPWGEVGSDKQNADGIPVLNKQEIAELVNWLFSSLPGGEVIKSSHDVPKWKYSPSDVLDELRREGNTLQQIPLHEQKKTDSSNPLAPELSALPKGDQFYASVDLPSSLAPSKKSSSETNVSKVFDIQKNPATYPEPNGYYIKKKFYTPDNLLAGKEFFEINCAVCHGQDANGTGIRSEIMQDAKPRMLTNLDWISSHDDIYLLRSIKYGVPGTSMTPWGDFTSSLQRMQLVMFIRSLSEENTQREELANAIYQSFDVAQYTIERARIQEFDALNKLQKQHADTQQELVKIRQDVVAGKAQPKDASALLEKEFVAITQLQKRQQIDQLFVALKANVKKESDLYQEIGRAMINRGVDEKTFEKYIKLVTLANGNRFSIKDQHLTFTPAPEKEIAGLEKEIIANIDLLIANLTNEKTKESAKISSTEINQGIAHLSSEINEYTKLKRLIITNLQEALRVRIKEAEIEKQLNESIKTESQKDKK